MTKTRLFLNYIPPNREILWSPEDDWPKELVPSHGSGAYQLLNSNWNMALYRHNLRREKDIKLIRPTMPF